MIKGVFPLKFTPLEFETVRLSAKKIPSFGLKFTPLEFETLLVANAFYKIDIKIYSVGVWNQKDFILEAMTTIIKIYSVGVWNAFIDAMAALGYEIKIYSVGVWNM